MKGRIKYGKKNLEDATISIYDSLKLYQSVKSDRSGWVAFQIPIQKTFKIKITKQNYVTKIISVDTHMPKLKEGNYYFEFTCDLFEQIEGLDISILREPVAKIFFNTFTKKFDYDYNYTAKINNEVKKMYQDYEVYKTTGKIPASIKTTQIVSTKNIKTDSTTSATIVKTDSVKVTPVQPKVIYSLELFTSNEPLPKNSIQFKGMINVKELEENGSYKYHMGEYTTHQAAKKMLENIKGYFPNAFIIAFKEGKKISESEALNISNGE